MLIVKSLVISKNLSLKQKYVAVRRYRYFPQSRGEEDGIPPEQFPRSVNHFTRFYALPEFHKPAISLRRIDSNIGATSYKPAKYLVCHLVSLMEGREYY